jgi:hypothetical protein
VCLHGTKQNLMSTAAAPCLWAQLPLVSPRIAGLRDRNGEDAVAFDTRLGSALARGAGYGIAHKLQGHSYGLLSHSSHGTLGLEGWLERSR